MKGSHRSCEDLQAAQVLPLQQQPQRQQVQLALSLSPLPWSARLQGAAQACHHALQLCLKHWSRATHRGMQAHCRSCRACCCRLAWRLLGC